jgi:hypothetical protein
MSVHTTQRKSDVLTYSNFLALPASTMSIPSAGCRFELTIQNALRTMTPKSSVTWRHFLQSLSSLVIGG